MKINLTPSILYSTGYFLDINMFAFYLGNHPIIIEQHENYQKRSSRNRCQLLGPQGLLNMSVPLKKGKHQQLSIKEVEISYAEDWVRQHLRTLSNCYSSSPFYEYYPQILDILNDRPKYLWQLNYSLLECILDILNYDGDIALSESYVREPYNNFIDLRDNKSTDLIIKSYDVYPQVFDSKMDFHPNISILDLIYNMGPEAETYLKNLSITFE